MTRVAIYARYSSDQQRDASIEDQLRTCRDAARQRGWEVVAEFSDHAVSGASLLRPGIQALMREAGRRAAGVAVATQRVPRFSLQRLFNGQPRRQAYQFRTPSAISLRPLISAFRF